MDGVSIPNTSPATLNITNESSGQPRALSEQPLISRPQEALRVNEGPSTITTISPQAQQLAQQEQAAGSAQESSRSGSPMADASPPPDDSSRVLRGDEPSVRPSAGQSDNSMASDQSGRAFDDRSPNSFLRN